MTEKTLGIARIAVDAAIFTAHDNKLKVLLHRREKEPFKDKMELLGGLLKGDETAGETIKKKLKETFGTENVFFQQFYTFTKPNRDPRARTVSVGFIALINWNKIADESKWHEYEKMNDLAFDHKEILKLAKKYLKDNISSLIVRQFMDKQFPLNQLQKYYEIIEEIEYDNRNFRKKMISSGIVEETKDMEINVSHRPAKLFRFK